MRLESRNAIVTGAAQGLGLAIAERFVQEGANLLVADVQADKVSDVAKRLSGNGTKVVPFTLDVGDGERVAEMAATAVREFGKVDILVNNAGGSGDIFARDIEDITEDHWDSIITRNLKGTFLCCRAVVPSMKENNYGRIVNFSSNIAKGTSRHSPTAGAVLPYASAKAGIEGFTRQIAKDLARWNIVANVVVPGFILTEPGARVRERFDQLDDSARQTMMQRSPRGRPGEPGEIASTTLFLSSEECGFVNGVSIDVTGGA